MLKNDCLLEISNLTIHNKKNKILNNIDLSVSKGEIILLAGQNGSGKSTLLKTIAGICIPDSGRVFIKQLTGTKHGLVGFLSDNCAMYSNFTIYQMIKLHCKIHHIKDFNTSLLGKFIPSFKKRIKSLSTGQKAILLLSLIIAQNPSIILIDEILQHIDPYVRETILNILLDMAEERKVAIIIVNHFTGDIEQIPDRVVLMNKGEITLDSQIDNLLNSSRKIVSNKRFQVRDLPVRHIKDMGQITEYFVYPVDSSIKRPDMERVSLTEAISFLIGGNYVR